ncbi:MAG: hypothetical protein ACKV2T_43685 [Kofleriaceae bacterium]
MRLLQHAMVALVLLIGDSSQASANDIANDNANANVADTDADADADASPDGSAGARRLRFDKLSVAVNAGLIQPLVLGGANLEVDLRWRHLVIAYSHGWNLELADALGAEMSRQHVSLHIPYTTGVGIGGTLEVARLRSLVDLRFEAKVHRFSAAYDSADGRQRTHVADYRTYTLGAGAYWTFLPFRDRTDALRGINLSTSVRFWPTIATSLRDDAVMYANATTNRDETHHAANIGIANTPLIVNVSLGYVFQ